jgi:hypothetical protein
MNVPVVYMVRYKMVLRRATSITRGMRRGGPRKLRLFWALKWLRAKRVPFGPKVKTIKYKLYIKKNRYMVILCTRVCLQLCCVLLCVGILWAGEEVLLQLGT